MADWFTKPEIVRLPLSDGQWIDVKRELTAKEARHFMAAQVKEYHAGTGRPVLDPEKVGRTKISAYLLAWSLPVPLSEDAIDNLRPARYRELRDAIDAHEEAVEAADSKNANDGEMRSAAISPSVN